MNLIFKEDLNLFSTIKLIFYILFGLTFFYFEYSRKFQLSYSKFNLTGKISPKLPMFFIYFIPLIIFNYLYVFSTNLIVSYHFFIYLSITIHFMKRCLEVVFLHKYSGKISLITSALITTAYSSIVISIHEVVNLTTTSEMLKEDYMVTTYIGFTLFLVGEISNFYHHVLLSLMRKNNLEYQIPGGGLFPFINCPHYLSEIIAWLGISIMSRYQLIYGLSFVMSAYLVARSINTTKWYMKKIPSFPSERKSIFPFIL